MIRRLTILLLIVGRVPQQQTKADIKNERLKADWN